MRALAETAETGERLKTARARAVRELEEVTGPARLPATDRGAGTNADLEAKGTRIKTAITPLEGAWSRPSAFSGKAYGQVLRW